MNIQTFSKLIRQSAHAVQNRITQGDIPAILKRWRGVRYWDISNKWVAKLLNNKIY